MNHRRIAAATAIAALTLTFSACGQRGGDTATTADEWPDPGKPIEIIVAFDPGGATDAAARLVAPVLEEELGTNVSVVNAPGAGGQIGYTQLTSAEPDGYTIGVTGSPSVVVSPLDPARGAQYTRESFQPLARQVFDPAVIGVAADSEYQTLEDLLEAAKAAPGTITASTTGLQGGEHFALADVQQKTGAEFAIVHFSDGSSAAVAAFLGGDITAYVGNVSDAKDLVDQGQMRVLGVMAPERSEFLPDVPTFVEEGYEIENGTARGFSAPAGLPDDVATTLEAALRTAIEDKEVQAQMMDLGLSTEYLSAADYEAYWADQEETYKEALPLVLEAD